MITPKGIDLIENFLKDTIGQAQFVIGQKAYTARTTKVEVQTDSDRVMVIAETGNDVPIGQTVTEMRLLTKGGEVFMRDPVSLVRSREYGLLYAFMLNITQAEGKQ